MPEKTSLGLETITNENNRTIGSEIWATYQIPETKGDFIRLFESQKSVAEDKYRQLLKHLDGLTLKDPSPIETLVFLCDEFETVSATTGRILLNLFIYINSIRAEHFKVDIGVHDSNQISSLLSMINQHQISLKSFDFMEFLNALNDLEGKNRELYYPCLALLEKRTFRSLLNGLMNITNIAINVTKSLEACDLLDSMKSKIPTSHGLTF